MLGKGALISFCQILALQPKDQLVILLDKHGITYDTDSYPPEMRLQFVSEALRGATPER